MKAKSKSLEQRGGRGLIPLHQESGVALVVVLAVLGMLTVLLVAFVNNVRVERISKIKRGNGSTRRGGTSHLSTSDHDK